MIGIIKFVIFILINFVFGFASLSQLLRIRSIILLIPISMSLGLASYIFTCHILSYLIGPQFASFLTLIILFLISIIILLFSRKDMNKVEKVEFDISTNQLFYLILITSIICILSFLAIYRFGTFDREFHFQLALTLFHNNIYPPKDFYKPEYVLLYHYGGDLLAGSIYHFCNFDISRAYELFSTVLSGTTFLSFFALAWLLTKNYKTSLIAGFCTYFGGGLLWLDSIIRYFFKTLPTNWGALETYLNIGVHGAIINAPSVLTFLSTSGLGNPLLILSLILFWKLINEGNLTTKILYLLFTNISLLSLHLSAEWLYVTFWAGVLPFLFFQKQKKEILSIFILLITSVILNKTIGNSLFLQNEIQHLGRVNIFEIGLKSKLFWVMSWGRLTDTLMNYQEINCFSWDFISEFGLSLFLSPIALIYLFKTRNKFALLLFLCAITTMPLPIFIEFKLNPVDFNRLFAFGNTMIVLLITCGIGTLFKSFFANKIFLGIYLIAFTLSPVSELLSSVLFTPNIYGGKRFSHEVQEALKNSKSINDIKILFKEANKHVLKIKNQATSKYTNEIEYLRLNSKPKDVAISSLTDIPAYAGVYSVIPSGKWLYKDLLYSFYDSIFLTTLTTLDPYLLNDLNIKWLLISNNSKNNLPKETQDFLMSNELFKLVYISPDKNYEIYHVTDFKDILNNFNRKTAWLLVNKNGQPLETANLQTNMISLFPSFRDSLLYLKSLQDQNDKLKKELITAQAISLELLERQIVESGLNIMIDEKF